MNKYVDMINTEINWMKKNLKIGPSGSICIRSYIEGLKHAKLLIINHDEIIKERKNKLLDK